MSIPFYDALIVGAGISGISAAYHIQRYTPNKSYRILERRQNIGGTWDLFNYPGIRSDSDMYTFGFNFRHWDDESAIAEKSKILKYLQATTEEYDIDQNIDFDVDIKSAHWNSQSNEWLLSDSQGRQYRCRFLFMCAGYYDYDEAHQAKIEGIDDFRGEVVNPQFWPEDLNYDDQQVVVIGSGATAITVVPAMAEKAKHVTMLQRSPTYMGVKPAVDPIANKLGRLFGRWAARWWFILTSMFIYWYCRTFPEAAKKKIVAEIESELGEHFDAKHFTPHYAPWDQRVCLCPDGDFFEAMKAGKVDVETDHIQKVTENGVLLKSGKHLDADLLVTATGLKIKFFGGIDFQIDDAPLVANEAYAYKGMMISGVPNVFLAVGYTNASWTLKVDLTHRYALRLMQFMDNKGYQKAVAHPPAGLDDVPLIDLSSGYIQRSLDKLPKQAEQKPWRLNQNFILDNIALRFTSVADDAMKFE